MVLGGVHKDRFHRLYALETSKDIVVGWKMMHPCLSFSFRRNPRGGLEMDQLANLNDLIKEVYLNSNTDRWSWLLDKSGVFAMSSVRNLIDEKILPITEFQTRWNKCVSIKINVHTWKIMKNLLPTRFNISRRGILIDSIKCPICDQGVETLSHLFFTCPMVRHVFNMINRWWSLHSVEVDSYEGWFLWIDSVHIPVKNNSLLEGVFQVMWWLLWYFRNKTIFEAKVPRKALFFDEVVSVQKKIFEEEEMIEESWLSRDSIRSDSALK
nr:RNA-directed DNA polymerase, eukaryota [Tanacetum cinerariifolium]